MRILGAIRLLLCVGGAAALSGCGSASSPALGTSDAASDLAFRPMTLPTGELPVRVALGDFDRDGLLDVCTLDAGSSNVTIRLTPRDSAGNRMPSPGGVRHVLVWDAARDLGVADFDGDGRLDLVVCGRTAGDPANGVGGGGAVYVHRRTNPDSEVWTPSPRFDLPSSADEVLACEVEGNGGLDVVTLDEEGGAIHILRQAAPGGGFVLGNDPPVASAACRDLHAADLDRDGQLDLCAVMPGTDKLAVWMQDPNGGGVFTLSEVPLGVGTLGEALALGDVDGDGAPDLLVEVVSEPVAILRQVPGAGGVPSFAPFATLDGGAGARGALAIGDLDRDGLSDVVIAYTLQDSTADPVSLQVFLQGSGGTFDRNVLVPRHDFMATVSDFGLSRHHVALGDIDGDGYLDVATVNPGGNTCDVELVDGAAPELVSFAPGTPGGVPHGPDARGVVVADLDRDGQLDVVIASPSGQGSALFGDPASPTGFAPPVPLDLGGARVGAIVVADLDRDGSPDLLVSQPDADALAVVSHGALPRSFAPPVVFGGVPAPADLAVGDLDRDGRLDVVCTNERAPSTVVILLPQQGLSPGMLSFQPPISVPYPIQASRVAVGDLNHDGRPDLVVCDASGGALAVNLEDPLRSPPPGSVLALAGGDDLALADLDRDGLLDIVTLDRQGFVVTYQEREEPGRFQPSFRVGTPPFVVGNDPPALAVGDLDGDGRPDLVALNPEDHSFTVSTTDRADDLPGPSQYRTLVFPHVLEVSGRAVVTGDFDRDGRPDIVVCGLSADFTDGRYVLRAGVPLR